MKLKYTLMAWLGLVGTACSNQDFEEKYADAGQVRVTAGMAKSRVSFNEADNMTYAYWQDGDAITLSTPTQGNLNYTATVSEEDATTASFAPESGSLKDINGETVYACYPASNITDGVVSLPVTDKWTDEKPLPFAYAVSSITDSKVNLSFEHTFAFLKLTLSAQSLNNATSTDGERTVHRLSVKSASGSLGVVSGTFNFEDKSVNVAEGSNEVIFTLSKAFNPAEETERSVYIPILPQEGNVAVTISLLHDYEGGEDVLLEMEKQTPADGLVKGYVYDLTLTGNSSAVIEGDSAEIHLAEAGTLSNYITDENKYTIKSLKLSGYLNGDDIRLLREMSTGNGILTDLDTEEATIVEGGGPYYSWYYTENDIWGQAFFVRTKLENVVLPVNVISIGSSAFYACSSLRKVTIPENAVLTSIGEDVFGECELLQTITLPASLTSIGERAFSMCSSLPKINIPDAVTTIGDGAFQGCSSLARVTMGTGVTSIGESAFSICEALTAIIIPEGVTEINKNTFSYCSALKSIVIPNSVTYIGDNAFSVCRALESAIIGQGVISIGEDAFYHCDVLKKIAIPDATTSIGISAFQACMSLETMTLGNSVANIGDYAFASCTSLKEIAVPESINYMGKCVFQGCTSLTKATNVILSSNIFHKCKSLVEVIVNTKTKEISDRAFWEAPSLKELVIPEGVTLIDYWAFRGCSALEKVNIPETVTDIASGAFSGCSALKEIVLPFGLTRINYESFAGCSFAEIVIPDDVTIIDEQAFESCKAMKKVVLGKNLTVLKQRAFKGVPMAECRVLAVEPPVLTGGPLSSSSIDKETAKLYVPKGSLAAYQESDWATYFGNIIEMDE